MPLFNLPPPTPAIIHQQRSIPFPQIPSDGTIWILPTTPNEQVKQLLCPPGGNFCFEVEHEEE